MKGGNAREKQKGGRFVTDGLEMRKNIEDLNSFGSKDYFTDDWAAGSKGGRERGLEGSSKQEPRRSCMHA